MGRLLRMAQIQQYFKEHASAEEKRIQLLVQRLGGLDSKAFDKGGNGFDQVVQESNRLLREGRDSSVPTATQRSIDQEKGKGVTVKDLRDELAEDINLLLKKSMKRFLDRFDLQKSQIESAI